MEPIISITPRDIDNNPSRPGEQYIPPRVTGQPQNSYERVLGEDPINNSTTYTLRNFYSPSSSGSSPAYDFSGEVPVYNPPAETTPPGIGANPISPIQQENPGPVTSRVPIGSVSGSGPGYSPPPDPESITYTPPEYDRRQIRSLAQQFAAPGIRMLRNQISAITSQNFNNPNVRRLGLREALQGFGIGIGKVISGAVAQASSEYAREYNALESAAKLNFQEQVNLRNLKFTQAMENWRSGKSYLTRQSGESDEDYSRRVRRETPNYADLGRRRS